jgi:purine-binding chemotaxis protein CheW
MAIPSPLRSRRLNPQKTEVTQQLITFKLRQETFAIPLEQVHKVTTIDRVYGDPQGSGIGLTIYQGQELVTIDVGQRIFGDRPFDYSAQDLADRADKLPTSMSALASTEVKYILILQTPHHSLIGLPIDSAPKLQSVTSSAFRELPKIYQERGNIHCVSLLSIETPDRPPLFLLDAKLVVSG